MLDKKYIDNISFKYSKFETQNSTFGITYINDNIRNIYQVDIKEFSFENLYANLLVELYNVNLIDFRIDNIIIERVKDFIINKHKIKETNPTYYLEIRTFVNSLYGRFFSKNESNYLFNIYSHYLKQFYDDLIKVNDDNILYVDVDVFYYKGDLNWDSLINPSIYITDKNVDAAIFFNMKRYALLIEGEFKTKLPLKYDSKDKILNYLKTISRENKLNAILS
jgi:hypothetical protein